MVTNFLLSISDMRHFILFSNYMLFPAFIVLKTNERDAICIVHQNSSGIFFRQTGFIVENFSSFFFEFFLILGSDALFN